MKLNVKDYIVKNLPPFFRNSFWRVWFVVLLKPFITLQEGFNDYKDNVLYKLSLNGQTIQLERLLNDAFDAVRRRIAILHKKSLNKYLYNKEEGQIRVYTYPSPDNPIFLRAKGENTGSGLTTNFLIQAPAELQPEDGKLKANVDRQKLAGKSYLIEYK
jgi:hypothetical protein